MRPRVGVDPPNLPLAPALNPNGEVEDWQHAEELVLVPLQLDIRAIGLLLR